MDPRIYGHAPVETDVHDGAYYLTEAGLLKRLGIKSGDTLRKMPSLMALRRRLSPGVLRWIPTEVDAWVASRPSGDAQATAAEQAKRLRQVLGQQAKRKAGKRSDRILHALVQKQRMGLTAEGQ